MRNDELSKFTGRLAALSGEIIREYFRQEIRIELKEDRSPVTIADKKTEEVMREAIMREYSDHGILGEEFGEYNPGAEYKWILDPIDGTKSFVAGIPLFGTLICLLQNGVPVLGAINNPILDQFIIGDNKECTLNGKAVQMRPCESLKEALLLTTDHLAVHEFRNGEAFESLIRKVKLYRTWGDCYGYFMLASGYGDIMIDPEMSPWDSLVLIPVIRGAGGVITDYMGRDPVAHPDSIVAAAPGIHEEVIRLLNGGSR